MKVQDAVGGYGLIAQRGWETLSPRWLDKHQEMGICHVHNFGNV